MRKAIIVVAAILGCAQPVGVHDGVVQTVVYWTPPVYNLDTPREGFTYCLDVSNDYLETTTYVDGVEVDRYREYRDPTWRDFHPVVIPVPFCDDEKWAEQFVPRERRGRLPFEVD